jgi:hypothetical protein
VAGEQGRDDGGGGDARDDLGWHDDECAERLDGSDEDESQRDLFISYQHTCQNPGKEE